MNYGTEFYLLYIDFVLIVYMFWAKIDSKKEMMAKEVWQTIKQVI